MQTLLPGILSGLDSGFADRLMALGREQSHDKGKILFSAGDPAGHLFILRKGRVRLSMGAPPNAVYTVTQSGEVFGWSAMTSREAYSATGLCTAPSTVLAFDRHAVDTLLTLDTANGIRFYKNLAHGLGNSLILARSRIADCLSVDDDAEYSVGKVQSTFVFV